MYEREKNKNWITTGKSECVNKISLSLRAKPSVSGCVRLHPPDDFLHRSCCSEKQQVHGLSSLCFSSSSSGCKLLFSCFGKKPQWYQKNTTERLRALRTVPQIFEFHARNSQNVIVRTSYHQKVKSVHVAPFYSQFVVRISFWGEAAIFLCPVIFPDMSEDCLNARAVSKLIWRVLTARSLSSVSDLEDVKMKQITCPVA